VKRMILAFIIVLMAAVPGPLAASDDYNAHFGDMDTNKDKGVVWEEFKGYFPKAEKGKFEEADMNRDDKIDHSEWHKFKEKYGYRHIEKK